MVSRYEDVDHIEIANGNAVHRLDSAVPDRKSWFRIIRTFERRKAARGVLGGKLVEAERALIPIGKPLPAIRAYVRLFRHGMCSR